MEKRRGAEDEYEEERRERERERERGVKIERVW